MRTVDPAAFALDSRANEPDVDPLDGLAERIAADEERLHERLPDRLRVEWFGDHVVDLLFPTGHREPRPSATVRAELHELCAELHEVLRPLEGRFETPIGSICSGFLDRLADVRHELELDAAAIEAGDPAALGAEEVVLAYPGFLALAFYRVAHVLRGLGTPLVPRQLTEIAHSRTGIDINPGAQVGHSCCIDHGTGLVVGETAVIGDEVKLYQGVTLGALSVSKDAAGTKRHPTIEDRVVIYANATVLGGETVVGHDSIVGGNVWLTNSVPPFSLVYHTSQVRVRRVSEGFENSDFVI